MNADTAEFRLKSLVLSKYGIAFFIFILWSHSEQL